MRDGEDGSRSGQSRQRMKHLYFEELMLEQFGLVALMCEFSLMFFCHLVEICVTASGWSLNS